MSKKLLKRNITKNKRNKRNKKNNTKKTKNIKIKYGGDIDLVEEQKRKTLFRRTFNNYISQISNRNNSRNKIKDALNNLINLFNNNSMINTLIPISSNGKYVDKATGKEPIVDFVSPIIIIFNNLSNVISDKEIIRILNYYFFNGGNFNNMSTRFKITPFQNELNKQRINNVKMLLDTSNNFHIIEDGLSEKTKTQLSELLAIKEPELELEPEQKIEIIEKIINQYLLVLPSPIPTNNDIGYDRNTVPDFWKGIFNNGNDLLLIRDSFMSIYQYDRYTSDIQKKIKICDLLETIIPGYLTKYTLSYRETAKTLINVNILNCFITLLYGFILYKLYETKQEYLFIFKGGRALQLVLNGIPDIGKYFSEDTDILIIPNKYNGVVSNYDLSKMENLSEHIAYLVKWIIPEDINVFVSLPTNPKNTNKDITKLLYNDGTLYKALSDIGFGEINEDIKSYFDNLVFSPFYINEFKENALFITPTLDDMLAEKLFYYSKYYKYNEMLKRKEPIMEQSYVNITNEEYERILFKFKRAILKLVESVLKRDYNDVTDIQLTDSSKLILRDILKSYNDLTNQEKENIIISIYP